LYWYQYIQFLFNIVLEL